jgi:hypothetical protein
MGMVVRGLQRDQLDRVGGARAVRSDSRGGAAAKGRAFRLDCAYRARAVPEQRDDGQRDGEQDDRTEGCGGEWPGEPR